MTRRLLIALCLLLPAAPCWARFTPVTCSNSFTQDQEIGEGNKVALEVYRQMPVLPENDPVTRYVQQLGARLVQSAPLAQGVQRQWPFNFHVVASEEINAFALPGGSIFVNLGTIQAADTEAQLAGVMAHEISHVVMRHSTCNLGKQRTRGLLYGLGQIGSAILLGNGAAGQLAQAGLGLGQNLDFLRMSRGDEQQADLLGVNILYNAGYDPRGLPQFFEIIKSKYGAGGAQFLSDHPNPGNRTEYVNAEIASLPPRGGKPIVNSDAFRQMHATAASRKALSAKDVAAGQWKSSGQYAAAPGSNGAVIPAGTTPAATSGAGDPPALSPLGRNALGLNDRMTTFQAARWSIAQPSSWKSAEENAPGAGASSVTLAPPGAAGSFGVGYGVLLSVAQQQGNGVSSAADLQAATSRIVQSFTTPGSGVAASGSASSTTVGGQPALSTELRGISPVGSNGTRLRERDVLITVARPDGDVSYLVLVSPEQDFNTLKPVFDRMVASFSPQ